MSKSTPSSEAEIKALQETYAALNRNDLPAFLRIFDSQIERVEPPGIPGGEIYRGLEAFQALVTLHRGNWAEGGCEPERFVTVGDRIVVFVHVRVRLKNEPTWREGHIADIFTFRQGKAIQFCTFIDSQRALEWAGSEVPGK